MKKILMMVALTTNLSFAMNIDHQRFFDSYENNSDNNNTPVPPFDVVAFLNQPRNVKENPLTLDERQKLAEYDRYLESCRSQIQQVIADDGCGVSCLPVGQNTRIPKKFVDGVEALEWLHRAILNDSETEVKQVVTGLEELSSSKQELSNIRCKGKDPLGWAVSLARSKSVNALLECGASPGAGYLKQALLVGDIKSALSLVRHGACFAQQFAAYDAGISHIDAMRVVLASYPQAPEECLELMQELFNRGYKIQDDEKNNIWRHAIHSDQGTVVLDRPLVKLFLKNGADINQRVWAVDGMHFPLLGAVGNGHLVAARALLEEGADPNLEFVQVPNKKYRLLSYAQNRVVLGEPNSVQMVELLKEYGAQ